jgi:PilZ domain
MEDGSEKRRHRRIKTRLQARYMLPDLREFACLVIDVAEGGIALTGTLEGEIGDRIIVYIDRLGRVEGNIVRGFEGGFGVALTGSTLALQKFAQRLRLLEGDGLESQPADRRQDVRVNAEDLSSRVALADGTECEILDLSLSGAEIKLKKRPAVGSTIKLGNLSGRVVRHSEFGVAVEFVEPATDATLNERVRQVSNPGGRLN